jgi:hypothetical protein
MLNQQLYADSAFCDALGWLNDLVLHRVLNQHLYTLMLIMATLYQIPAVHDQKLIIEKIT